MFEDKSLYRHEMYAQQVDRNIKTYYPFFDLVPLHKARGRWFKRKGKWCLISDVYAGYTLVNKKGKSTLSPNKLYYILTNPTGGITLLKHGRFASFKEKIGLLTLFDDTQTDKYSRQVYCRLTNARKEYKMLLARRQASAGRRFQRGSQDKRDATPVRN